MVCNAKAQIARDEQSNRLIVRRFDQIDYQSCWQLMKAFTDARQAFTLDEIWFLQHPPVYTLGQAGDMQHLLTTSDIPVIHSDRGGQITYHGPGQLIIYVLMDLNRKHLSTKSLVHGLEQTVIDLLNAYDISAKSRCDAPGVYVAGAKICSLGLRVRRFRSFHGLALNVDMDLSPFENINPCGLKNQTMTQLANFVKVEDLLSVAAQWLPYFLERFGYDKCINTT